MNFYGRRFNLYFCLAATLAAGGCATGNKEDKQPAQMRVHIERAGQVAETGQTVPVLRGAPVDVNIATRPILTEANLTSATLLDTPGGFAVKVQFDETGTWILEQYSSANPGKHFVVSGQWGKKPEDGRWLAAPLITRRIANGVLSFTPDASREEAVKFVKGLNLSAKKNQKDLVK